MLANKLYLYRTSVFVLHYLRYLNTILYSFRSYIFVQIYIETLKIIKRKGTKHNNFFNYSLGTLN